MNPEFVRLLAAWLLTTAVHGSVLLGLAWLIDRVHTRAFAWRELMWRCALFGGVITAGAQMCMTTPLHWRLPLPATTALARAMPMPVRHTPTDTVTPTLGTAANDRRERPASPALRLVAAAPDTAPASVTRKPASPSWPVLIVAAWLAGVLLTGVSLLLGLWRLRRMLRGARALHDGELARHADVLAHTLGLTPPHMFMLDGLSSPVALPGTRIVVPAWANTSLGQDQQRALLAHELTHLQRHDPHWKLLLACWQVVFWFLPLMAHARRRLDTLAELACDATAARHTGDARHVAECLAACAEHHLSQSIPHQFAAAMAAHESSLMQRIERLLEGVPMQNLSPGFLARAVAGTAIALGCFGLPAVAFVDAPTARAEQHLHVDADANGKGARSSVSIHEDSGHDSMSVSFSNDGYSLSAKVQGKITFNAAETDVASMSAGGTARFEETRNGKTRRLELAEQAGRLQRNYFVDGHAQTYDAGAREWFAKLLPTLIRETGLDAQARVKRLYASGGARRVLDEIERIHSEYVSGRYLQLLLDMGPLKPAELDRAVQLAGAMDSDYERGKALSAIFAKQSLSAQQQIAFLKQAQRFGSDYELAQLLIGVEPKLADSDAVRQAWLDAASKLSSDYERRRAYESMLKSGRLDDKQLASLLASSSSIGSDYEHRVLLTEIARHVHDADALAPQYTQSVRSIGSDYEHREALLALIHTGKLGTNGANAVLDSAARIGSDYECREVLMALARVVPMNASTQKHYRQVAQRLSSNERDAAEQALVR